MSSTNKTPNLELSQFLANDIPSWLGDYNGDMLKIDTAVQSANATASAASGTATTASNQAQNALNVANSAETRSTNNAEDITELKGALTFASATCSEIANTITYGSSFVYYSDYLTKIVFNYGLSGSPTNTTTVDIQIRTPLFSCPGNIFKIPTSTISDDNNKLYCGPATAKIGESPYVAEYDTHCYYDGANTVFYLRRSNGDPDLIKVWGTCIVAFTGEFVSTF